MTWIIDSEALLITTKTVAEETLSRRVYDLSEAIAGFVTLPAERQEEVSALLRQAVQNTVAPHTWQERRGEGNIESVLNGRYWLVSQTFHVHRQLARLMVDMRSCNVRAEQVASSSSTPP